MPQSLRNDSSVPIIGADKLKVTGMVQITRSFTYKLNVGNYEARDFFCSQHAECRAEDAEAISEMVHDFCKRQVMKAVQAYKQEQGQMATAPVRRSA